MSKPINEYPVHGLMPKQDTQAAAFIKKYPQYDGRGTVVAILDTGVDPGAAGMQITTDGKPKIVDIVDCTGGGDVNTTQVVRAIEEEQDGVKVHFIQGLSGRRLIVDPSWVNPSGEYRVGVKRAYELFPGELVSRLKSERKEQFEIKHAALLKDAQARLAEFRKNNTNINNNDKLAGELADLEARVEGLKELLKAYEDPGVILDCVVFHDGQDWRAVIDVEETGDLRGQPALADYRKEFKYHTFGKADLLNFSVNIYDNGDLLSIVTLSGSHGTHVAGIVAANFPEEPALNGVAPGAQIVSLRIGDSRLGSMETGPGLTRAAAHLAMNKVDLANMSYGESSSLPSQGHFIRLLAEEAISKSGCIFVTSAGNDGPCFSSIGAPAGMDSSFVTVGAYVKHSQMLAEYALLESVDEKPYTWSSRGPCTDGYHGVDVYAPGSAITSVPVYGLNKLDLKNGTSMSSPNACGCIALLVSGLKAENRAYTPYRLKTAVVQSSKDVKDPLKVGFIQVEKAWEYLENFQDRKDLDIIYNVSVSRQGKKRGIYLRELDETSQIQYVSTRIEPTFMGEADPANPKYNWAKFEFEARVALVPSETWISAPDYVYLPSSGNTFQIKVDPTALKESQFHYGEVLGYDTSAPERGPLFRVPVSVVKPSVPSNASVQYREVEFGPGDIMRKFIHVPEGATYAHLIVRSRTREQTNPARFMLHLLQLVPKQNQKKKQTYNLLLGSGSFGDVGSEDQVIVVRFAVRGGLNMEFCLAQFWSSLGRHSVDLDIEFHGVQIAGNLASNGNGTVHLEPQVTRLDLIAPLRKESKVDIQTNFNKLRKYLRPTDAVITPLNPERNTVPDTRVLYALNLTYAIKIDNNNTTITPRFPTVMNQLYEHFLAGVFGIVYDANKKVVGYLDVFDHSFKLEVKGDYTIVLQLTSEEEDVLEKLKTTICELDLSVKSVNFVAYATAGGVYTDKKSSIPKLGLERRDLQVCYIAPPGDSQQWVPKEAKPGDALVGSLAFTAEKVDGGQYKAIYVIPPEPSKDKDSNKEENTNSDEKVSAQLKEAIRDLQISYLDKYPKGNDDDNASGRKALLNKLEGEYANDIVFLLYKIDSLWKEAGSGVSECLIDDDKLSADKAKEIIAMANQITAQIDQRELHEFFGRYPDKNDRSVKDLRKENDKKKEQLAKAYKHKAAALAATLKGQEEVADVDEAIKELRRWSSDENDLVTVLIKVKRDRVAGLYGSALKAISKYLGDLAVKADTIDDQQKAWTVRKNLYNSLGWAAWSEYDQKWAIIRRPPGGFAPL
ncbi:subtilase family-domain-containing protein [Dichotomocladium elegans]|nr:subtilase family-domain-containing protein [Dichotomocladium elegans]